MGLIDGAMGLVFGGGRNVIRETAEVFRENAEGSAVREAALQAAALGQFAAEFQVPRQGGWDRFIDGLNRLPRPAMALGTLAMFVSAMVDPVWFAARMNGIALVPEPLWWLLGAIVSFYFGARHQAKAQDFQRSIATTVASTGNVVKNLETLERLAARAPAAPRAAGSGSGAGTGSGEGTGSGAGTGTGAGGEAGTQAAPSDNPALADWARDER